MKKLLVILMVCTLIFSLTACGMSDTGSGMNSGSLSSSLQEAESKISSLLTPNGTDTSGQITVTRDQAIDKALKLTGLKREDITNLEVELDSEREGDFWEIEFDHKNEEFSIEINAKTGEATKNNREQKD